MIGVAAICRADELDAELDSGVLESAELADSDVSGIGDGDGGDWSWAADGTHWFGGEMVCATA